MRDSVETLRVKEDGHHRRFKFILTSSPGEHKAMAGNKGLPLTSNGVITVDPIYQLIENI